MFTFFQWQWDNFSFPAIKNAPPQKKIKKNKCPSFPLTDKIMDQLTSWTQSLFMEAGSSMVSGVDSRTPLMTLLKSLRLNR